MTTLQRYFYHTSAITPPTMKASDLSSFIVSTCSTFSALITLNN